MNFLYFLLLVSCVAAQQYRFSIETNGDPWDPYGTQSAPLSNLGSNYEKIGESNGVDLLKNEVYIFNPVNSTFSLTIYFYFADGRPVMPPPTAGDQFTLWNFGIFWNYQPLYFGYTMTSMSASISAYSGTLGNHIREFHTDQNMDLTDVFQYPPFVWATALYYPQEGQNWSLWSLNINVELGSPVSPSWTWTPPPISTSTPYSTSIDSFSESTSLSNTPYTSATSNAWTDQSSSTSQPDTDTAFSDSSSWESSSSGDSYCALPRADEIGWGSDYSIGSKYSSPGFIEFSISFSGIYQRQVTPYRTYGSNASSSFSNTNWWPSMYFGSPWSCQTGIYIMISTQDVWNYGRITSTFPMLTYEFTTDFIVSDIIDDESRQVIMSMPLSLSYGTGATFSTSGIADFSRYPTVPQNFIISLSSSGWTSIQIIQQLAIYLDVSIDTFVFVTSSYTGTFNFQFIITYGTNTPRSPEYLLYLLITGYTNLPLPVVSLTPSITDTPAVNLKFPSQTIRYDISTKTVDVAFNTYTSSPFEILQLSPSYPFQSFSVSVYPISSSFDISTNAVLQNWILHFTTYGICQIDASLNLEYRTVNSSNSLPFSISLQNLCPLEFNYPLTVDGKLYADSGLVVPTTRIKMNNPVFLGLSLNASRAISSATFQNVYVGGYLVATSSNSVGSPAVEFTRLYGGANQLICRLNLRNGYFSNGQLVVVRAQVGVSYAGTKRSAEESSEIEMTFEIGEDELTEPVTEEEASGVMMAASFGLTVGALYL